MRDGYQELLTLDAEACPIHTRTWSDIKQSASTVPLRRRSRRGQSRFKRNALIGAAAVAMAFGGLTVGGMTSPAMAKVLMQVPGLSSLIPWFNVPVVQQLSSHSTTASADQGISLTVPDVYYDGSRLRIHYRIQVPQGYQAADKLPQLNYQKLNITLNGQPVQGDMMGGDNPVQHGAYEGDIDFQSLRGSFPTSGTLKVAVTQIGNTAGNWSVTVPISSKAATGADFTQAVMKSQTYNGVTLTVKSITAGPVTTTVSYELVQPMVNGKSMYDMKHYDFRVGAFDEHNTGLMENRQTLLSQKVSGNTETDEFTVAYQSNQVAPKKLALRPMHMVMDPNGKSGHSEFIPQLTIGVGIN